MPVNEPLTWAAIVGALGSIAATAKLWMGMGATQQKAHAAERSVHEAHQRIDRLTETSATTADIAAAERRFAEAVSGLRSDFQHMAGRLDTLLAALIKGQGS